MAQKFSEIDDQPKFAKFLLIYSKVSCEYIAISILQHFECVPVKLESMTDERDEQLLEPNGFFVNFSFSSTR